MDNENTVSCGQKVSSATPVSALDLNSIKLDVRHTVLTPDYLEKLENDNV